MPYYNTVSTMQCPGWLHSHPWFSGFVTKSSCWFTINILSSHFCQEHTSDFMLDFFSVSKPPFSSLISVNGRMEYRVLSCDGVCLLTCGEEPLC